MARQARVRGARGRQPAMAAGGRRAALLWALGPMLTQAIPSYMDDDGNVVVNGHPHIIIAPQSGYASIGGDPTDVTLAVEGDASFDGGIRLGSPGLACNSDREGRIRRVGTGDGVEFCDSEAWNRLEAEEVPIDLMAAPLAVGQSDKCANLYTAANPGWENLTPFWWELKNDVSGEMELVCCGGDGLCAALCYDGVLNGHEEQIDCGGADCGPCECPLSHVMNCEGQCTPEVYIGDRKCDNELNCNLHDFDGGDCSVDQASTTQAAVCYQALKAAEVVCGPFGIGQHCAEPPCEAALARINDLAESCYGWAMPAPYLTFPSAADVLDVRANCTTLPSCKAIKNHDPSRPSGVYWITVVGYTNEGEGIQGTRWEQKIQVYCDMETYGGGWTLIAKTRRGDYVSYTETEYMEMIANPVENINPELLQNGEQPGRQQMGFYNREITNSFVYGENGESFTIRLDLKNYEGDMDLWLAMRDATVWGDVTPAGLRVGDVVSANDDDPYVVNGFGRVFSMREVLSQDLDPATGTYDTFDPVLNTFTHEVGGTGLYQCGDAQGAQRRLVNVLGNAFYVCPKMGLLNNGQSHSQDLWLLTADPEEQAFMRDGEDGHSAIVWIR